MTATSPAEQADDDFGVLRAAQKGNVEAFEQILKRHEQPILRVSLRMTGCLEDAQDTSQETFLRLHRNLRRFSSLRDISPWLYRVAVNLSLDLIRKRKRFKHASLTEIVASDFETGRLLENDERRRRIDAALLQLPDRERAALILRDLEELSTTQIAEITGSAASTVRVQIAAARLKLRKLLAASEESI